MANSDWLITATPPTPNGDLHVGHMSGPYLAADIFKRARLALDDTAVYVCYGDDNQSYVVTTASGLGKEPGALSDFGNAEIAKTLSAYQIDMTEYGCANEAHENFVRDNIQKLIVAGLVVPRQVTQLTDPKGSPLYESFAGGCCRMCLEGTRGGICEACGHPNDPLDLLSDEIGVLNSSSGATRLETRLILPIEDYRDDLIEFYRSKRGTWRPHLIKLVDELLSKPLADYPISHPGTWGISFGLKEWDGHVINVWAEMGLGLVHALKKNHFGDNFAAAKYVQFLGFDNSYFFAIVHPALQFALARAGCDNIRLPDFIVTNEFYQLEHKKFSTSQGHAMWGRELLDHMSSDEARYVLALQGPELSQSNFDLENALRTVKDDLRSPLRIIRDRLARVSKKPASSDSSAMTGVLADIGKRFDFYCEPENFSTIELARTLRSVLKYASCAEFDERKPSNISAFLECIEFWGTRATIIMPKTGRELLAALPSNSETRVCA